MSILLLLISGCFEGFMDVLQFHYANFKKKHLKVDDYFWDEEISWVNKYDENFKPKYFGSTTFLVFTTDGWHLFKMLRNITLFSSIFFVDNVTIIGCLFLYGINRIGFYLVYNILYK